MFDDPPEPVLAIPGALVAGAAKGRPLPHWRGLWDDDPNPVPSRWSAEHATRYLAAEIAVGTVDQAMLGALQVKHAHLRCAALSRSLIVIDEVHASDAYMHVTQKRLVDAHVALGGHALLMSATLGSAARSKWLGAPWPDQAAAGAGRRKRVTVSLHPGAAADAAAVLAGEAARGLPARLAR